MDDAAGESGRRAGGEEEAFDGVGTDAAAVGVHDHQYPRGGGGDEVRYERAHAGDVFE